MSKWTISISRQKLNILKEKKDRDKHREKDGKKKKRRVEMFNTDDEEFVYYQKRGTRAICCRIFHGNTITSFTAIHLVYFCLKSDTAPT